MTTAHFYVPSNGEAHSPSDIIAMDYMKRRASQIVTDGEFPHMPVTMMFPADVPTPAAPAAAVH